MGWGKRQFEQIDRIPKNEKVGSSLRQWNPNHSTILTGKLIQRGSLVPFTHSEILIEYMHIYIYILIDCFVAFGIEDLSFVT